MTEHINNVKTLYEHLEAVEDPVNEKDLVTILISCLLKDYNYLITPLETIAEDKLTWDYVRYRLIYEADKIKNGNAATVVKTTDTNHDVLFTTNKKPDQKKPADKKSFKCHFCHKTGHFTRDCYKKKAALQQENPKGSATGSFAKAGEEDESKVMTPEISFVIIGGESENNQWFIDSGASRHMTPDKKSLVNFGKFKTPTEVKLADNSVLYSYGKGDVYLSLYNGPEKVKVELKNVLYLPKIQNKLISLPSMTAKGATVEFKGQLCTIVIDGKSYQIGYKQGKLYKLKSCPKDAAASLIAMIRRTRCHYGICAVDIWGLIT